MNLKSFLHRAFNPFNNSLNIDAVITITGLAVWTLCIVGQAFGYANIPPQVSDVGTLIFGLGIGRSSKGDVKVE